MFVRENAGVAELVLLNSELVDTVVAYLFLLKMFTDRHCPVKPAGITPANVVVPTVAQIPVTSGPAVKEAGLARAVMVTWLVAVPVPHAWLN
ncbi:hypothetical protein GCM10023091_22050 [Ravibacter arvi]|uniref:Uncharacterized protein n=1 Tax=Ravibacter arvi TaxID=2051041 RepID=A0ABP8M0Q1_9BACT